MSVKKHWGCSDKAEEVVDAVFDAGYNDGVIEFDKRIPEIVNGV